MADNLTPTQGSNRNRNVENNFRSERTWRTVFPYNPFIIFLFLALVPAILEAQVEDTLLLPAERLKKLSLEDLMNIEVVSVSMRAEKLSEVASAIQVITDNDIAHSAATRLPELLKLTPNIQMAQANSHDWAITARGFNGLPSAGGIVANKLLVMIDGRSVYSPLFGGVFWDVQNVMLEDVDKIEVVSGPGGTLWGANAVNGVINVVTKSSRETQGLYVSGASGNLLNDMAAVRIGARSRVDTNLYYRIYAQHFDQNSTLFQSGASARDAWDMVQGGFRMDYYPSKANILTLQGDFYGGDENKDSLLTRQITNGQNVLGRFTHVFSDKSDLKIQAYYDRTYRLQPTAVAPFLYSLNTYDLDIQHRFSLGERNSILYGGGYRLEEDNTNRSLTPLSREMPVYNVFIQDEIALFAQKLKMTVGSKFLNNVFTGFEFQPCVRLAWTPGKSQTLWASVSRAVRTPSRFDSDILTSDVKFQSEKVMAYELGYHLSPVKQLTLSFAAFFNHYNQLRSIDQTTSTTTPFIFTNDQRAESWGFEFSGNYQVMEQWRLRGGYTYFDRNIWAVTPAVLPISVAFESMDPKNTWMIQSMLDVTRSLTFDLVGRYVDPVPGAQYSIPDVPAYYTCDARLAWHRKGIEISLVGQNLLQESHIETGRSTIPRAFYAKITCKF